MHHLQIHFNTAFQNQVAHLIQHTFFFFFQTKGTKKEMLRDTSFPCVRGRNKPVQLKWYLRKDIIYRS